MTKWEVILGLQGWFNVQKLINVIYHISRLNQKPWYDHLNRFRKSLCQNSTLFMVKTLSKLGLEGSFLDLIKDIYRKPTTNIKHDGEN